MTNFGYTESPVYVSLGHELAHRVDKNTRSYSEWGQTWYETASDSEIYASHVENLIRMESGLPLRTHYGVLVNYSNDGKKTGQGIEPTRLIDFLGNSLHYNEYGNRVQPRPSVTKEVYGGEIYKNRYNYYGQKTKKIEFSKI